MIMTQYSHPLSSIYTHWVTHLHQLQLNLSSWTPKDRKTQNLKRDVWKGVKHLPSKMGLNKHNPLLAVPGTRSWSRTFERCSRYINWIWSILLDSIRKLAVISIVASVQRTRILSLRQDHGQPICSFAANWRYVLLSIKIAHVVFYSY